MPLRSASFLSSDQMSSLIRKLRVVLVGSIDFGSACADLLVVYVVCYELKLFIVILTLLPPALLGDSPVVFLRACLGAPSARLAALLAHVFEIIS